MLNDILCPYTYTIYHEKNEKNQYRAENYREEVELLRSHMQDARRQATKASCFWHNGWQKQKR